MRQFIATKTCFWGPQPGAESLVQKGDVVMAHGNEPNLDEFFEAVDPAPAGPKGKAKGKTKEDEAGADFL